MKRSLVFVFLLLIFVLPLASASDIEFVRPSDSSSFDQGETLIVQVTGNFVDQITRDKVFFYRDHVRVPMNYDVLKSENDYYIYALLTNKEQGNYSISVEDVRYYQGIPIVDEPFNLSFSITENTAAFSISPGFAQASESFTLSVQNLQPSQITVDFDLSNNFVSVDSLSLQSGEIENVLFELDNPNTEIEFVEASSENTAYSVPVFISGEVITDIGKKDFSFEPGSTSVSMATNSETKRIIYLKNTGDETIEDITFNISSALEPYVTITPSTINNIEVGSAERIEITLISDDEEGIIEGQIIAISGNLSTSFTLVIDFIQDYIPTEDEQTGSTITTCEELSGQVCQENEECSGEEIARTKGAVLCCLTECNEVKEPSGLSGKLIGWGIIILILILVLWFFKRRYKRVGPRPGLFGLGRKR
jgi:hypothetical protein